jgi:hypothetical protein
MMGCARRLLVAIVICTAAVCASAQSQRTVRIRQPIDLREMTRLRGGVSPLARPECDQGALDPSQIVHRVKLIFSRSAAQQQALDILLQQQQDPNSPNYHNWLTPEESSTAPGRPSRRSRPPQTYVTVQATSGTLTHTAQVRVAVN